MLTYMRIASSRSFIKPTDFYQTICHIIKFWKDPSEAAYEVKSLSCLKGKKNTNNISKLPTVSSSVLFLDNVVTYYPWAQSFVCLFRAFLSHLCVNRNTTRGFEVITADSLSPDIRSRKPEASANHWLNAYSLSEARVHAFHVHERHVRPKVSIRQLHRRGIYNHETNEKTPCKLRLPWGIAKEGSNQSREVHRQHTSSAHLQFRLMRCVRTIALCPGDYRLTLHHPSSLCASLLCPYLIRNSPGDLLHRSRAGPWGSLHASGVVRFSVLHRP